MSKKINLSEALAALNEVVDEEPFEVVDLEDEEETLPAKVDTKSLSVKDPADDINAKIIQKLVDISTAVAPIVGQDPEDIFKDMVSDLRLINGDKLIAELGDHPLDQATAGMAEVGREIGLDSNVALNALLQMDPEQCVAMTRELVNRGGALPMMGGNRLPHHNNGRLPFHGRRVIEGLAHRYLIEGENVDKVYDKYYAQAFKKPEFEKIIKLDPTFSEEEDKLGRYGQWLLTRFRKKELPPEDMRVATEVLNDFNERKQYLNNAESKGEGKEANKGIDINAYKSVKEVRDALDCIELTANQVAAKNRKAKHHTDLGDEAEFIAETPKWEIWSPKTYNASTKLGSGTTWCTASTSSDHWYHHYADNGKLFIFNDKTAADGTRGKKIQLHVDRNGHVTDFKEGISDSSWRRGVDDYEGFTVFLEEENLRDVLKGTEIGRCDAFLEAINMEKVKNGEPFIYGGGKVKANFKPLVKKIVFADGYEPEQIPHYAFAGCTALEEITLPPSINSFGYMCFKDCPDNLVINLPRSIKRIDLNHEDREFIAKHIHRI